MPCVRKPPKTLHAMNPHLIPSYLHTTELAADAMISEGGAIRQPSKRDAEAAFARLGKPCRWHSHVWNEWAHNPAAMFLTGFAAGLAVSLLERANHPNTRA